MMRLLCFLTLIILHSACTSPDIKSPPKQSPKEADQQNTFIDGTLLPSQTLRAAYEESSQHSAMADIAELSCFPTSRFDCSAEGCRPAAPATYYFVDYGTESGTYFRCDAKGCDSYPVTRNSSGIFMQFIPSQGQAMMLKVVSDDTLGNKGDFVDVATIGLTTIISYGKCVSRFD